MSHDHSAHRPRARFHVGWWYVFFGLAAALAYFLLRDHGGHIASLLPYLLLAACPLMHLFHRHGGKHKPSASDEGPDQSGDSRSL